MKLVIGTLGLLLIIGCSSQNKDPLATEIVTSDLNNFWDALNKSGDEVNPEILDEYYLNPGTNGVKGFTKGRIVSAEHLSKVVRSHINYYRSLKPTLDKIPGMKDEIRASLVKLKDLYPEAIFPPVYFVIGALNSGGTSSDDGLIIGVEMYGLTSETPTEELDDWLKTVIKSVDQAPHIVAHELIHYQQNYDGGTLLVKSIKEGAADFIAELISGKHINQHVHDFANPKEKELWIEFKNRMSGKDYKGWLYSSSPGRPNDLGYWMGYKITKAYYDKAVDKREAIRNILRIKNFEQFLEQSGYGKQFN